MNGEPGYSRIVDDPELTPVLPFRGYFRVGGNPDITL